MKEMLELALGIVTSIGGFLEVGSITNAAQVGAMFGMQLIWAVALGGLCIIFLVEEAGRFAAVTGIPFPMQSASGSGSTRCPGIPGWRLCLPRSTGCVADRMLGIARSRNAQRLSGALGQTGLGGS